MNDRRFSSQEAGVPAAPPSPPSNHQVDPVSRSRKSPPWRVAKARRRNRNAVVAYEVSEIRFLARRAGQACLCRIHRNGGLDVCTRIQEATVQVGGRRQDVQLSRVKTDPAAGATAHSALSVFKAGRDLGDDDISIEEWCAARSPTSSMSRMTIYQDDLCRRYNLHREEITRVTFEKRRRRISVRWARRVAKRICLVGHRIWTDIQFVTSRSNRMISSSACSTPCRSPRAAAAACTYRSGG